MFEWLKNMLFDEEDVVVEEEKLEEIDFSKVNDFENILSEPKKTNDEVKHVAPVINEKIEVVNPEERKSEVPLRSEFNIQVTEATPKKENPVEVKVKRSERVLERKEKDLEVNTIISPMFGGGEVRKADDRVVTIPSVKKKDGLGTVISPMYGQEELILHEQRALAQLEESIQPQNIEEAEDDEWKDEVPLDELISNDDVSDDCVQFSLFGDSQAIDE